MPTDAEKVISLSLCKMAESRCTRRGGASLHKHLLITSVLSKATRARSAFLDTWYMEEDSTDGNVDLNISYQEADFPKDELDSTIGENPKVDIYPSVADRTTFINSTESQQLLNVQNAKCDVPSNRSCLTEVENEMDLPPDILSCMEKLGDLNDRIFSTTQRSASRLPDKTAINNNRQSLNDTACQVYTCSANVVVPDIVQRPEDTHLDTQASQTLTYLDLDAGSSTTETRGPTATSTPVKRRREWCFEDEDDDDQICGSTGRCIETPVKSHQLEITTLSSLSKNCKRLRLDVEDSSLSSLAHAENDSEVSTSRIIDDDKDASDSFRLTYDDADDSDDDSFLDDTLSQGQRMPSPLQMVKTRQRNDRRVPSGSSSGSDEDGIGEKSMEVDQLTNLVQFISFSKQHNQAQNTTKLRSVFCVK